MRSKIIHNHRKSAHKNVTHIHKSHVAMRYSSLALSTRASHSQGGAPLREGLSREPTLRNNTSSTTTYVVTRTFDSDAPRTGGHPVYSISLARTVGASPHKGPRTTTGRPASSRSLSVSLLDARRSLCLHSTTGRLCLSSLLTVSVSKVAAAAAPVAAARSSP